MRPVHLLFVVGVGAIIGAWWTWENSRTAALRSQLQAVRLDAAEREHLQGEHTRLEKIQPEESELERLRGKLAAHDPLPAEKSAPPAAADLSFQPGAWTSASQWKNRGQATPEATLETTFWAVAGGELGTLKEAFAFDDASRIKAQTILDGLPESARRAYATPEDLLTLLVVREIPLADAQWFARVNHDVDTVTDSLELRNAEGGTQQVHLTFHREGGGWRLVVPPDVVERMTNDLQGVSRSPAPASKAPDVPPPQGPEPKNSG